MTDGTVLLEPWTGDYGGVPPWDRVTPDEFEPAFARALESAMEEITAIAENPAPPTFENTIGALERAGRQLDRLEAVFGVHADNLNRDPIPDLQRSVEPRLAAHSDAVIQNQALFERVSAVHAAARNGSDLDPAQRRLVDDYHQRFVRNGAGLGDADKEALSALNQELAGLYTEFVQNVLGDEAGIVTWVTDRSGLDGLPDSFAAVLAAAGAELGRPDAWAVRNTRASMDPFLTYATDRGLREQVWRAYYGRGDNPGERDNKPVIGRIVRLRAERARLLGYRNHAEWRLEVTMAKTPETAMELMERVWTPALERAREEIADMQALADREATAMSTADREATAMSTADREATAAISIQPWDYRFYAEKVRKERYDLDFNEVKPYLQLEKLIEAMLWCSSELYGLTYTPIEPADRVPTFHPDVRVWEVTGRDGSLVGLWYLDPYAREGKLSGAWMTEYRPQDGLDGSTASLVSNNSNFVKGAEGEPVLISWDDASTLFHEFGHALHGLLSDVVYPSQAGTSVPRDYVEFPSQINEHWLITPEVLNRFCTHVETGEPMPADLIERIERAARFNQGFETVEYLACALLDMELHQLGVDELDEAGGFDPGRFEREALARIDMPDEIPMRHRFPHFSHLFSSEAYSAGYYSYLWSDVLTADAAEAFEEAGGYFDPEVAERLRANVFSVGDTIDPAAGYRSFRGRDADPEALLRKRGFAPAREG